MSDILRILREKSLRELSFRIGRIAQKKLGILKRKFPVTIKHVELPSLMDFRQKSRPYFFQSRSDINVAKVKSKELKDVAERILNGETLFFSKEWINLGKDYDWVTNPTTGFTYDRNRHWSEIESLAPKAGDIKCVWEKSRFSYLYHIIRYDYHFGKDNSRFVFNEILSWIDNNPVNCGPNFVCSQEISLRINNWLFALMFYKDSEYLTEEVWNKIIKSIYWQVRHVYSNINFSRIAVRNNHAITETLTLYLFGLLFPELLGADKWKRNGKKWFEREIAYQFEPDGTYLQESMNYQRVVTQLLTWGIALAHLNGEEFSSVVYENAYHSLDFLLQCMEPDTGWLPNYGANDGALFFPLSTYDYRDYRPQLDSLHYVLTGRNLFGHPFEDSQWLSVKAKDFAPLAQRKGIIKFEDSGYYLIREDDTLTFVRCGNFKRKGTPDQLHIDVWHKNMNVLLDGGSYRYNASPEDVRYFSGTESHNTVMLGDNDQMLKGPRFMWFYPPEISDVLMGETDTEYVFSGTVRMFRHIGDDIVITRTIKKTKGKTIWTIEDVVNKLPQGQTLRQLWHIVDQDVKFESTGKRAEKESFFSSYYRIKESCRQVEFQSKDNKIITTISL